MPDSSSLVTLTPALWVLILQEALSFVPHDDFSMRTSPKFWLTIFIRHFGNLPTSDVDPRWDELFKKGFPLLRFYVP